MLRIAISDGWLPRGEVDFVQLRMPHADAREVAMTTRRLLGQGYRVLVNDRLDVALACGAQGVHLRGRSIAPSMCRKIAPEGFLIFVACHDVAEVNRAAAEGADYAVLAPVFHPLSKPAPAPPLGPAVLREACRAGIPVVALGGVTEENTAQCIEAGAAGVAAITLFRPPTG